MTAKPPVRSLFQWGVASRPSPGETSSGDLHLVEEGPWGGLAAVIDGIGHGAEAMEAARVAAELIRRHPGAPVLDLVRRCHQALKPTRGAVMTLIAFNPADGTASAVGIGNVEALILRAAASAEPRSEHVLLRAGLVGYHLPALQASELPISPGDIVIFATDGVRDGFIERLNPSEPPQAIAEGVLKNYFRGHDDGLVLALRYLGGARHG